MKAPFLILCMHIALATPQEAINLDELLQEPPQSHIQRALIAFAKTEGALSCIGCTITPAPQKEELKNIIKCITKTEASHATHSALRILNEHCVSIMPIEKSQPASYNAAYGIAQLKMEVLKTLRESAILCVQNLLKDPCETGFMQQDDPPIRAARALLGGKVIALVMPEQIRFLEPQIKEQWDRCLAST